MFGKEIFVVGDLNCDMLRKVRKLMLLMIYAGHCITSESSTLIDIIMTSDDSLVTESGVEEIHISDHFLVYSILKLKLPKPAPIYVTARSYKHYVPERFVNDLWQMPWFENALIDDINDKLEHFNVNFLTVLDRHAPVKTMKIRYRQCPFVEKETKDLMREREKLHRLARITQLPSDWNDSYLLRNVIKKKLRDAEKVHIQREISKNYDNKNSLWKTIKKCIPRKEVPIAASIFERPGQFNQ